jgi:hypothetical protein
MKSLGAPSADLNEHAPIFDFDGVGFQVDTDWRAAGLSVCEVEAPIVLWALDDRAHDQPISKMHPLMSAKSIRREKSVVSGLKDCKRPTRMVEANDVFRVDSVGPAGVNPILAHFHSP